MSPDFMSQKQKERERIVVEENLQGLTGPPIKQITIDNNINMWPNLSHPLKP